MFYEPPLDPPDDGEGEQSDYDCPDCDTTTTATVWTNMIARHTAAIETVCDACGHRKSETDYSYGYDG